MRVIITFSLLTLLVACSDSTESKREQEQSTAVEEQPSRSSLTETLLDFEKRLVKDAENPELYAERATAYIAHDSIRYAINDLKRAIRLDSTNARYHIALGEIYFHKIRIEEASQSFRTAVKHDDNANDARLKLAEIELLLGNYQRTFDIVNEALKRDKHLAQGYFIKGMTYGQVGDTSLAISSFKTAVEQRADYYDAYMQLGVIHDRLYDPLALDYFNTACELSPNSIEAHYGKAMFLQNNGQDSLALLAYDKIKEIDPRFPAAWYNSGYVYLEHLNNPERAIEEFNEACRVRPDFSKAFFSKGLAHERLEEGDKAGLSFQLALSLEPGNAAYAIAMERAVNAGYQMKDLAQ